MTHISVDRDNDTGLKRTTWRFYYMGHLHALVLDYYAEMARPTRRHKFVAGLEYVRLDRRRSNMEAPPIIPEDIETEVRDKFTRALRVMR